MNLILAGVDKLTSLSVLSRSHLVQGFSLQLTQSKRIKLVKIVIALVEGFTTASIHILSNRRAALQKHLVRRCFQETVLFRPDCFAS